VRRSIPARALATVPVAAVGIIATSEVPLAMRSLAPKTVTSTGTMMTPPPMPNMPAATPMTTPSTTSPTMTTGVSSIPVSRAGTSKNRRIATSTSRAMNIQRSHPSGSVRSSRVPTRLPAMPPAATSSAAARSASPPAR